MLKMKAGNGNGEAISAYQRRIYLSLKISGGAAAKRQTRKKAESYRQPSSQRSGSNQ